MRSTRAAETAEKGAISPLTDGMLKGRHRHCPRSRLRAATEQGRSWSTSSLRSHAGPPHPGSCTPLPRAIAQGAPALPAARLPRPTPAQTAPPTLAHAHLWKTPESRAARRTQPISGTPARCLMFFRGMPLLPPRARIRAARCGGFSTPRPWPPRELRCSFGGRPREGRPRGLDTEVAAPFSTESIFLPRLLPSFSTSGSSSLATSARRRPISPPEHSRGWLFQLLAPPPPRPASPRGTPGIVVRGRVAGVP